MEKAHEQSKKLRPEFNSGHRQKLGDIGDECKDGSGLRHEFRKTSMGL